MSDALDAALRALVGRPCWSVVAGRGNGSVVAMDLGDKLRRGQPLKNPQLSDEQRQLIGEYWLLAQCAWRLDAADGVVCGSADSNAPGGRKMTGLASLVGATVTAVERRSPGHDLVLWFGADRCLSIFCDATEASDHDNYSLAVPGEVFGIQAGGAITREERFTPPRLD
jgi:hypothetical protein